MPKKVDTSTLKLLWSSEDKTEHLISETETDKEAIRKVVFTYIPTGEQSISTYKRQKFYCIGGPFNDTYQLNYDFDNNYLKDYYAYKTILVYTGML